jgi:hypothetical protein
MSTGSRPATSTRWWPATLTAGAGSAGAEPQSKREFGRLNYQWSLPPLRGRGLERVRLQADLTILARLACALARTRAAPLEA